MDVSYISPCMHIFRGGISVYFGYQLACKVYWHDRISADSIGRYIGSDEPISVIGISVKSHRYANPGVVHILGGICPRSDPDISPVGYYLDRVWVHCALIGEFTVSIDKFANMDTTFVASRGSRQEIFANFWLEELLSFKTLHVAFVKLAVWKTVHD